MNMSPGISIGLLADHPPLIPAVGEMRWREWGHPPEPEGLDWWVEVTAKEAGRDCLPACPGLSISLVSITATLM